MTAPIRMWESTVAWLEGPSRTRRSGDFTTAHVEWMLRTGVGGSVTRSELPERPHAPSAVRARALSRPKAVVRAAQRPLFLEFSTGRTLYSEQHELAACSTKRTIHHFGILDNSRRSRVLHGPEWRRHGDDVRGPGVRTQAAIRRRNRDQF